MEIVEGYLPGSIGPVIELHATYYNQHAGFGLYFESKVACELCEFFRRYDAGRDGVWLVCVDGRVEASIVIDGIDAHAEGAHLCWFIVSDAVRGTGFGQRLITAAIEFCREKNYKNVYLWTFEGLNAARRLYEKNGFRLSQQQQGNQWGLVVDEQRFELRLP